MMTDPNTKAFMLGFSLNCFQGQGLMFTHLCNVSDLKITITGKAGSKERKSLDTKQFYSSVFIHQLRAIENQPIDIEVGEKHLYFVFLLPKHIPSSFEGVSGFIRYELTANLEVFGEIDLQSVKPVTVLRQDDPNQERFLEYLQPYEAEKIKTFCCLFCKSDPLIMTMKIPKTVYNLGETIPIHIEIVNLSTTNIDFTEVKLREIEAFNFDFKNQKGSTYSRVILSKRFHGAARFQIKHFDETFEVPKNIPASCYCDLCAITHTLTLIAYPTRFHGLPSIVKIPITVANFINPDEATVVNFLPDSPPRSNVSAQLAAPDDFCE